MFYLFCVGEGRLSDWTSWGQCSATCEGLKSRTRTCNSQQVGDVPCIDVTQTAKCGTEHCPGILTLNIFNVVICQV